MVARSWVRFTVRARPEDDHRRSRGEEAPRPYCLLDVWHEVSTLGELDAFLDHVGGFHDGILKEIHWINGDHVGASSSMLTYKLSSARLLVQRQWKSPSAVEIVLDRVWTVTLDTSAWIYDSVARTERSSSFLGEPRDLLVLDLDGSTFSFERMRWRDASEWMGPEPRFGPFAGTTPTE